MKECVKKKHENNTILLFLIGLIIFLGMVYVIYNLNYLGSKFVSYVQYVTRAKKNTNYVADKTYSWLKPIKTLKKSSNPAKNVISYSYWGDLPMYVHGATENLKLMKEFYGNDWKSRFYVDDSVPEKYIEELKQYEDCDIILMPRHVDCSGAYWRFLAFADPDLEHVCIRDLDSRITQREYDAVKEWIQVSQQYPLHTMDDFPTLRLMSAGVFDAYAPKLKFIIDNIESLWPNPTYKYGDDENFLCDVVYPIFAPNKILNHDSSTFRRFFKRIPMKKNFARKPYAYEKNIGNKYDVKKDEFGNFKSVNFNVFNFLHERVTK